MSKSSLQSFFVPFLFVHLSLSQPIGIPDRLSHPAAARWLKVSNV